jgi:hypothetical protein
MSNKRKALKEEIKMAGNKKQEHMAIVYMANVKLLE